MVVLVCILVLSITIYWKTIQRDGKWEENCQNMLKNSTFFIIDLYRKIQKSANRPHFVRTISWEPSLLLTNGKKLQFRTDLYFKISLTCFLTLKKVRTPPLQGGHFSGKPGKPGKSLETQNATGKPGKPGIS